MTNEKAGITTCWWCGDEIEDIEDPEVCYSWEIEEYFCYDECYVAWKYEFEEMF